MPFTTVNRTRILPRPPVRRPRRPVQQSGGVGAPISQVINPWNFAVRVSIAFEPPTSPNPTWIEVTNYVDTRAAMTITRGRSDGVADVNAARLTLTADNSDGRWFASNPNGAWFGLIRKGAWIKVDVIPPSGVLSTRFVGFITVLPTVWQGQYASSTIAASDRFERLGQNPAIVSTIQSEVLTDPNLSGNIKGYWNLHEPSVLQNGLITFGDTSGQGAAALKSITIGGVLAGTGLATSNANSPGFDGTRCPTFNPTTNTQGTYLTAPITMPPTGTYNTGNSRYYGLFGTLEFWFQATTTGASQYIAGIVDPLLGWGLTCRIDAGGTLVYALTKTTFGGPVTSLIRDSAYRVDDGRWHHLVLGLSPGTPTILTTTIDALRVGADNLASPVANFTQLTVGAGFDTGTPGVLMVGAANISDVAWYWSDYYNPNYSAGRPPNIADHYNAGTNGFLGESTDQRVARIARYAGVPIPLTTAPMTGALSNVWGEAQFYSPSQGPWTNLSLGAHQVGTQSMANRTPLDVMREAARTEAMPLFVDRSGYLALQPSTIRQNTSPAWTVAAVDLHPSTAAPDDFAYTTNVATITPNGQAAQTVIGGVGSAGQASQAKYGIYSQGGSLATASLNPTEAQSLGLSLIQLRADPAPRWSPLAVEVATLATQPGYGNAWLDAVLASEISTPFRVTNLPSQAGGGNVDVLIEGWTETITAGNIVFSFGTSPIQGPTYQLDDVVLGHIDTDGSALSPGGCGAADATLSVATLGAATGSPLWTTAVGDFPFDVNLGGEQVTVTGITGGSSPQTFAVTRSINGVVASHPANTPVALWQPLTLAY